MTFHYFRVCGSFELEVNVPEEDIRRSGTEVAFSDGALQALKKEVEDALGNERPVTGLRFDEAVFLRTEETEDQ